MKFISQTIQQIDAKIETLYDLSLPNSAFKKVIPSDIKIEMRNQYIEYLEEKKMQEMKQMSENQTASRSVSTKIVRVNIASLREAGYCVCPEELAVQCEDLLRSQETQAVSEKSEELNVLTANIEPVGKNSSTETVDKEMESDTETTDEKSEEAISTSSKVNEILAKKAYPKKVDHQEFIKAKVSSSQQKRTTKRKYFTKYMSDEFSKDIKPVEMNMMDSKTQELFQNQNFNELVSEITGIN
mmetsp:Transcript_21896/g.19438  ORF Transcript_21896/g.19438 Transcript_21896/m.19438 type:complete len:242 (+) Transcript_21896:42-767(+)